MTISRTHDPGVSTVPYFSNNSWCKFGQELKHEAKSMDEEMKREKERNRDGCGFCLPNLKIKLPPVRSFRVLGKFPDV